MIAEPPKRRRSGRTGRDAYQLARRKKLTADERGAVVLTAGKRTLRELAADFGVSHETVRGVIRDAVADLA